MNIEMKSRWLKALRSGKYKQGKYVLKQQYKNLIFQKKYRYCSLGVLCEVAGLKERLGFNNSNYEYAYEEDGYSCYTLSEKFKDDFDIPINATGILIDMNDQEDANFIEIARWIETHL